MCHTIKRALVVIILTSLASSVICPLVVGSLHLRASTTLAASSDGWEWQNPLPQGNTLLGVWGSSSSDVFAVGEYGTILHYDGISWSAMSSNTTNKLYAIWGSSFNDVFAVGEYGSILHYDGSNWTSMGSGTAYGLHAVWGSSFNDVFAVGYGGTIIHYDGSSWIPMSSGTTDYLMGIWGSSASDIFAIGSVGAELHYDGDNWSVIRPGQSAFPEGDITYNYSEIWGSSSSDIFIVGVDGPPFVRAAVWHNGSETTFDVNGSLDAVWGSSSSDVFAVGEQGTILHYDGAAWSGASSGTAYGLNAIWGSSSSDVFAVGAVGTILHYDGATWTNMTTGATNALLGIWGTSSSDVFAVGSWGAVLRYDGSTWDISHSGGTIWLTEIWGTSSADVFAAGGWENGLMHWDGASWSPWNPMPSASSYAFDGLWGSSSSDFYVCRGGDISHYDGSAWSTTAVSTSHFLSDLWGSSASNIFAVGSAGTIFCYNGSIWNPMPSGTTKNLNDVWGSSSSDVFAVGYDGTIIHYDGSVWTSMTSGTTNELTSVWGSSSSDVFAVGGTILHYDGSTWSPMAGAAVSAIWGSSSSDVFAVGGNGTILHYAGGAPPNKPANTRPIDSATGVSLWPDLDCSAFSDPNPSDRHSASQWQITSTSGDYSSPVFDSTRDTRNLTSMAIMIGTLNYSTTYYWRVRHQDSHGNWSDYSAETSFTTLNLPPDRPGNLSPPDGATGVILTPTLQSSAFSDPDQGNTQTASQWQIRTDAAGYSSPVFDSGVDSVNLTAVDIPSGVLAYSTTYRWHVRHQDNHGEWSDYSTETTFTTFSRPPSQPSNTSPENAATGVTLAPTLIASSFADPDPADTHAASQWQIRSTSGDYSSPAFDSATDTTNLTEIQVPVGPLTYSTTYHWHVRYQDNRGVWSDWSSETSFATPPPPQAEFDVSSVRVSGGAMLIFFSNLSSGGVSPLTYAWDFDNDGTIDATEREPWHRYMASGTYTVSLTVTDAVGIKDTETKANCLTILPPEGGKMETADGQISTDFPSGAVAGTAVVTIESKQGCQLPDVPQGFNIGDTCFVIMALDEDGSEIVTLSQPTAITVKYSEADVARAGGDPENLVLAYWDEAAEEWKPLDTVVNTAEMTLTASTTHLSTWAILVAPATAETQGAQGVALWIWIVVGIAGALAAAVLAYLHRRRIAAK